MSPQTKDIRIINSKMPSVSVIVPTYNRHRVLLKAIRSLVNQVYHDYEVIVVDQTTEIPYSIKNFLSKFSKYNSVTIKYIHLKEKGLPNARNVGIKNASGEIVIFMDDDAIPLSNNFIRFHAENYMDPNIVGVVGRVEDPGAKIEKNPNKILKLTKWGTCTGGQNGIVRTKIDLTYGCNMSFRKADCINAGLFDPCIIGSAQGEDTEFCLRLQKTTNKSLVFDPRAAVKHYPADFGGCESRAIHPLQRNIWRFHNMTLICLRNREKINLILFLLGRILAMIKFSFKLKSLNSFYWLSYSIINGFKTYKEGKPNKDFIEFVKKKIR